MRLEEFIKMLELIQDKQPFDIGYHLLREGRLKQIIYGCGGIDYMLEFFRDIQQSDPPEEKK